MRQIITDLIDIVSKNGMLLLNIGPKPDGTITDGETLVLKTLGAWLKMNGEGIYGTTFWKQFGEGDVNNEAGFFRDGEEKPFTAQDYRFTYKGGAVYCFQMRPDGKDAVIRSLCRRPGKDYPIARITLLETGEELAFDFSEDALTIRAVDAFQSEMPICFKIELA